MAPVFAAPAPAAADHRVAGDAPAQPAGVHTGPERGDHAGPLVSRPQRVRRRAVVQVAHLAVEQLRVSTTEADALDVDDDLPGRRDRGRDVLHLGLVRPGEDQRPHQNS